MFTVAEFTAKEQLRLKWLLFKQFEFSAFLLIQLNSFELN